MTDNTPNTGKVTIEFRSHDKATRVPAGMSLFNAASWIGLPIDSTCGAKGTCGKCKVRIIKGESNGTPADRKFFTASELAEGWRLSCRTAVYHDTVCDVPRLMGNPKAALLGMGRHVILDPNVHKVYLELTPPSLVDQRSDHQRVIDALMAAGYEATVAVAVLRPLPRLLRDHDWRVTAVLVGQEIIAFEAGDTRNHCYGFAFDIGTTTVVASLLNLNNGAPVAVEAALNQQAVHGADVIARISHTMMEADGLRQLHRLLIETLNALMARLIAAGDINADNIYELVVAGNATMLHLLQELDPGAIGVHPFIPVVESLTTMTAGEMGLPVLPQARVHMLPHLGAYVGADLVGGLLATGLPQQEGVRLLVDVGTNGEIILGSAERTIATAAPAGPAFEGASIKDGMRASDGAIEAVEISADSVKLQVIGDCPPIGLCGSGLLDAVAQLYQVGLLTASGRFIPAAKAERQFPPGLAARILTDEQGLRSFVLAWPEESGLDRPLVLTQRDIRELQFAKGAIASGIAVLMAEMGVTADELVEVYLAGSFGNYINPWSARLIGLVPPVPVQRIKAIGNAAGEGAKIALLSFRERAIAAALPAMVEYHELSAQADFNDSFLDVLQFPAIEAS